MLDRPEMPAVLLHASAQMNKYIDNTRLLTSRIICRLLVLLLTAAPGAVHAQDASSLRARYVDLKDRLANNQFKRPLFLERNGCRVEGVECTDRYVQFPLGQLLNLTPLRYLMG